MCYFFNISLLCFIILISVFTVYTEHRVWKPAAPTGALDADGMSHV